MTEDKRIVLERKAFRRLRYLGVKDAVVEDFKNHAENSPLLVWEMNRQKIYHK